MKHKYNGKKAAVIAMASAMALTCCIWVSGQEADTLDAQAGEGASEEAIMIVGRFDMPQGLLGDNYYPMSEDELFSLDDYIMDLEDANKTDVLTADGQNIYLQSTQNFSDGYASSASTYISQDYSYYTEDWFSICFHGDKTYGTTIDENGQVYPQAILAIGDGAQDTLKAFYLPDTTFQINEGEELCAYIEGTECDNLVYSVPLDNEVAMSYTENSGYDPEAGSGFYHIVGIDPATKKVIWSEYYYELDGEDIYMGGFDVLSEENISPDAEAEASIYEAADSHTVTFIVDPGTAQEETHSITVGKGYLVGMYCTDESKIIYDDAACTTEHSSQLDTEGDYTLYLK